MIEKTTFGSMTIKGRIYTTDLMIFPDGSIVDQWWRAEGHRLTLADMKPLVDQGPSQVIAGMGIYGRMKAEKGLEKALADKGIELITAWTKAAAERFNATLRKQTKVAACFHLTC
jgi:hypothetical protein